MRNALVFLLASLSLGCTTERAVSHEKLVAEVNSAVHQHMSLAQAQATLKKLGFKCMQGTSFDPNKKDDFECTRNENGLLFSCIHRVWIEVEATENTVANVQIHPPSCASL